MKNKKIFLIFFVMFFQLIILTGCSSSNIVPTNAMIENNNLEFKIDYNDAETFENDLNNGINTEGKVVKFKVIEYNLNTLYGNNAWAGEHLNFISKDDPQLNIDNEVVCKIVSVNEKFGSWYVNYEILEIIDKESNVINDEEEKQEMVYYEYDETINKYVTLYNDLYPDNKITSEMLSIFHHHGSDHKDQAKLILDDLSITISSGWDEKISIYIENSSDDNVIIKNLVKRFVKVFDNSIKDETVDLCLDKNECSIYETNDNIDYSIYKDGNGERIIYMTIDGSLKNN